MGTIPDWFETAWWKCGLNLEGVWPVTRGARWKHRYVTREYWTYITVTQGTLEVVQGAWRGRLAECDQVILPPGHPFDVAVRSQTATFLTVDFRVVGTPWAEDPLPKIGLPVVIHAGDTSAWRRGCRTLAMMFGPGNVAKTLSYQARPVADAIIAEYLVRGFREDAFPNAHNEKVPDWLVNIKSYLLTNYNNPDLTLERLIAQAGYSPTHVHRVFKRVVGMSPMAYVAAWRLGVAARTLDSDPFENVVNVATRCGFHSAAYFTRAFTKHYGMPPTKWRRRSASNAGRQQASKGPGS